MSNPLHEIALDAVTDIADHNDCTLQDAARVLHELTGLMIASDFPTGGNVISFRRAA